MDLAHTGQRCNGPSITMGSQPSPNESINYDDPADTAGYNHSTM